MESNLPHLPQIEPLPKIPAFTFLKKEDTKTRLKKLNSNDIDRQKTYPGVSSGRLIVKRGRPSKEQALACRICGFFFPDDNLLEEHMKYHTDVVYHECPYCKRKFSQKGNLQTHLRIHTNYRPFKCTYCTFAATQKINLQVHVRKHTKEKPYQCNFCNFTAAQVSNINSHVSRRHRDLPDMSKTKCKQDWEEIETFCCQICRHANRSMQELADHIKEEHSHV